jgi:hypothetical protein
MIYKSPQLMDDLILGSVKNPAGTTANDQSRLIASHGLRQMQTQNAVDAAGKSLGLAQQGIDLRRQGLAEDARRFNANMGLARGDFQYNRRAGNTASILSGLGLGVSALGDMAARNRAQQQLELKNSMIQDLENSGDQTSQYWAKMLKFL